MDQQNSFSEKQNPKNIQISIALDDFDISEESFKPMTKGLGFHQEQKRQTSFKPTPKVTQEVKSFSGTKSSKSKNTNHPLLGDLSLKNHETATKVVPNGLEAFYGAKPAQPKSELLSEESLEKNKILSEEVKENNKVKEASSLIQLSAWIVDLLLIASFVIITTALLVAVSGMGLSAFMRVISKQDLSIFGSALFSIYYLLYFTILDLSATPGKTVFGVRLLRLDNKNVSVKNTFTRSLVTLLSFIALLMPNLIDFQGRLSDTKVVK
jgi:uncharacterized RDD family membrane protein YckC